MMPGEKPKNFKKSFGKLLKYIGRYRFADIITMITANLYQIGRASCRERV